MEKSILIGFKMQKFSLKMNSKFLDIVLLLKAH